MEFSAALKKLGRAIASHPNPVQVAYCGFDLWLEVLGSGRTSMRGFTKGGKMATGHEGEETFHEGEETFVVQVLVIGDAIVVNFDPTLPPDGFRLAP